MYTIRHYKKDFSALTVAIVGDILHSRRALADPALKTLGCRTCAWWSQDADPRRVERLACASSTTWPRIAIAMSS
jgi:hypothetical protein